jgi:hypothetical protein
MCQRHRHPSHTGDARFDRSWRRALAVLLLALACHGWQVVTRDAPAMRVAPSAGSSELARLKPSTVVAPSHASAEQARLYTERARKTALVHH